MQKTYQNLVMIGYHRFHSDISGWMGSIIEILALNQYINVHHSLFNNDPSAEIKIIYAIQFNTISEIFVNVIQLIQSTSSSSIWYLRQQYFI